MREVTNADLITRLLQLPGNAVVRDTETEATVDIVYYQPDCNLVYLGSSQSVPDKLNPQVRLYDLRMKVDETEKTYDELLSQWSDTFTAFMGAFDNPVSRRQDADEYSIDSRQRMRTFDAAFRAFLKQHSPKE